MKHRNLQSHLQINSLNLFYRELLYCSVSERLFFGFFLVGKCWKVSLEAQVDISKCLVFNHNPKIFSLEEWRHQIAFTCSRPKPEKCDEFIIRTVGSWFNSWQSQNRTEKSVFCLWVSVHSCALLQFTEWKHAWIHIISLIVWTFGDNLSYICM